MNFIASLKKYAGRIFPITWLAVLFPGAMAARPTLAPDATIEPIGSDLYNDTITAFFGNGSWDNVSIEGVGGAIFQPYVNAIGPTAYVILTGALGLVMYIKTESVLVPGVILAADGVLFMWWLPYDLQYISYGFVIIGMVAMILGLVLKRRY